MALLLFFVPLVNIGVFFAANAYLLGREYFELAAGRFRPIEEASRMRQENRGTVLLAGALLAGLVLVPVLNLLPTPLFGVALMVHVHKRLAGRALPGRGTGGAAPGSRPDPGPVERGAGRSGFSDGAVLRARSNWPRLRKRIM